LAFTGKNAFNLGDLDELKERFRILARTRKILGLRMIRTWNGVLAALRLYMDSMATLASRESYSIYMSWNFPQKLENGSRPSLQTTE
jgi:hypothetical protein